MAEEETKASEETAPWHDEVNSGKLEDFGAELGKDVPSKGTFAEDYSAFAAAFELVACPFFKTPADGQVRLANTKIDLASWRAMLLSISTAGSVVKEVAVHGCSLTVQHVTDLVVTLEKIGAIEVLKIDYITLVLGEGEDVATCLLPLLSSEKMMISYLSLKGCGLGDDFVAAADFYKHMSENVALKALSLANNQLSDAGVSSVLKAMKVNPAIADLNLAQNTCTGDSLLDLKAVLAGAEASADEEAAWKNVAKHVGDKNKNVKDANKARKKRGFPDLVEVHAPAERVVKVGEVNCIANRTIRTLDLSFCPLGADAFQKCMQSLEGEHLITEPALSATLIVRGRSSDCTIPPSPATDDATEATEGAAPVAKGITGLTLCY